MNMAIMFFSHSPSSPHCLHDGSESRHVCVQTEQLCGQSFLTWSFSHSPFFAQLPQEESLSAQKPHASARRTREAHRKR